MKLNTLAVMLNLIICEDHCGEYVGEFHLVYDISASFKGDLLTLKTLGAILFDDIEAEFPGSRYGMGTFSDKAFGSLGGSRDICYQTNLGLTTEKANVKQALDKISLLNGGDDEESQLDALFHGMSSKEVNWSTDDFSPSATDINYHVSGDAAKQWWGGKQFKPHDGSTEPDCLKLDYPTKEQVKNAFKSKDASLLVLASKRYMTTYKNLINELDITGSVIELKADSSNVIEAIKEGLKDITCEIISTSTTTPPPTTTPTTTAPPTSTPTTTPLLATTPTTILPPTTIPSTVSPPATTPSTVSPPTTSLPTTTEPVIVVPPPEGGPGEGPGDIPGGGPDQGSDEGGNGPIIAGAAVGAIAALAAAGGAALFFVGGSSTAATAGAGGAVLGAAPEAATVQTTEGIREAGDFVGADAFI